MKATGEFILREFSHKDAGEFSKDGKIIEYGEKYKLKFDEITENGDLLEFEQTIGIDETDLIDKLEQVERYSKMVLELDVLIYPKYIKIKVIDVILDNTISTNVEHSNE